MKFQSSPFFLAGPGALRIPRCSAVAIEVPCRMRLAERLWHLGDRSTTRGRRWGRNVCREKRCQNMMKRTSNGGKPWENLGKMLGKPQGCWEYAGDLLVRKPMVKPNGFFMIKPFKKRGKQTSQSHVDPLSWSHGQPAVAVQRAL